MRSDFVSQKEQVEINFTDYTFVSNPKERVWIRKNQEEVESISTDCKSINPVFEFPIRTKEGRSVSPSG